ncbi:uncharacterized protein COLE_03249 [Cutaneotrichosporon oleaginosum]|nr:hypothetical protein COLE_03249 [Cutaneotrichosporon oleaginosum]
MDGSDDDDDGEPGGGKTAQLLTIDSPAPQQKRPRQTQDVPGGFTYRDKDGEESSRRRIRIEYITDRPRRHITFSKRKAGIMKKAYELSILTGTQVLLLVVSETGLVYTFTTSKLQPLVTKQEGKSLIQACLSAPDGYDPDGEPTGAPLQPTKGGKNGGLSIRPHKLSAEASKKMLATAAQVAGATPDEAQARANHAAAQAQAVQSLGNGTPVSQRPKKRLPSRKRSSQHPDMPQQPEVIPPVPPIPDIHRQSPSSQHMMSHGQPQPNPMHSPLSGGYHMPPDYAQAHHPPPGMPSPTYGYPTTSSGPPMEYGAAPTQMAYGYHPAPGHQGFIPHPGMYQPQHQPPHPSTEPRRMMPPNEGSSMSNMGM